MLSLELALWHRLDLQIFVLFKVMRPDNEEEKEKSMTSPFFVPQSSSLPNFPVNYWPFLCLHNYRNPVKVLAEIIAV